MGSLNEAIHALLEMLVDTSDIDGVFKRKSIWGVLLVEQG